MGKKYARVAQKKIQANPPQRFSTADPGIQLFISFYQGIIQGLSEAGISDEKIEDLTQELEGHLKMANRVHENAESDQFFFMVKEIPFGNTEEGCSLTSSGAR